MKPNIELTIDKLVLHGFSPQDTAQLGQAIEQELIRLFQERGVPSSLSNKANFRRLNGESFRANPNTKSKTLGHQIAKAVYTGFKP